MRGTNHFVEGKEISKKITLYKFKCKDCGKETLEDNRYGY